MLLFALLLLSAWPWWHPAGPYLCHAANPDIASFYGGSYISMPLQDAKSTTELRLRFRTKRPDALLFLAAGKTDYCLVRLESGRLKVHVNLGAGESELNSAKGLRLDDLSWHEVYITRRDADMTVQVDTIHVTKESLPGRFYELNIHFGLFVGGQGDFSELFLGHQDNLRGCMADVNYNGVNVLARARERIGAVDVHGVTWSCAEEFDVGPERDVSFVEDGAFIALPNAISRTGAKWQFELKTGSKRGVLLYNTGLSSRPDFVGVELEEGKVRLLVDKGDGSVSLHSDDVVSDGRWHKVIVLFNPTYLEISVDNKVNKKRLNLGGNKYWDLAEIVYMGGIELNKRSRALTQGLKSGEESFKGCMRNIEVDGKKIGVPEARVTLGILPECVWDFPCARDEPCVAGARCLQHGVDSFRCECEQPLCVKADYVAGYKVLSKASLPVDLEIVALNTVSVSEGGNVLLTPHNMDVVLDYRKFGVRDAGVIFRLVTPPKHGRLQVEQAWQRSGELVFTLLDMAKDKVRLVHDGSENHFDSMELDLELNPGSGFTLPAYLQGRHRFVLPINVTAVNDPPELIIPAGKVLRLAQGTVKVISSDLLQVHDPDTPSSELVYNVLSVSVGGKSGTSQVQLNRNPVKKATSFSQKDVDEGVVVFNHSGEAGSGRIALQVSDGIEAGTPSLLRVVAFALQLRLVNNTGLVMTHNSSTLILTKNLAFVTNADEPESIEIKFEVMKAPQFGVLQRLRSESSAGNNGEWQNAQHFTSFQLAREQIRYLHTSGGPTHDEFKFQVAAADTKSPTTYDFRIIFVELRLDSVRNEEITLDGVQDGTIRSTHLHYDTVPQASPNEDIVYHIGRTTKYGFLILSDSANSEIKLNAGDTFSQQDIDNGKIRYVLKRRAYSRMHDEFTFRVATTTVNNGEPSTDTATFSVVHIPGPTSEPLIVTLERLEVVEGGQQVIAPSHLHLVMERIASINFNVTKGCRHGRIDVLKNGSAVVARQNASFFSSKEVAGERVVYVHDDSESRKDTFHFLAWAPDFQYLGVFHLDILLRNDNKPTRTVDRVFRVVKGGERLLTGDDLRYEDLDVDTRPEDLIFTRRGIPNGGIFSAIDPTKAVYEFTQADLNAGRILFRHDGGDEYGKVVLHVSDGDSYASGVLEVRASSPFVEVVNNSGLVVQKAAGVSLSPSNLSVETNVNAQAHEVRYLVLEPPSFGQVQLDGDKTKTFTQHDIEQGGVVYHHDGGKALKDHFRFRVEAGEQAHTEGRFELSIFPAAYWEPLQVMENRTLHVEESTSVQLGPAILKVMHPQIPASDITFIVQEAPQFGYLELEASGAATTASGVSGENSGASTEVSFFEQATVDAGRLHYVQAASNATRDHVVVDVTNGIWSTRGLWLKIVVVPKHVYVQGGELTVAEGALVPLTRAHVAILTEYYATRVSEFKLTKPPKAGKLLLVKDAAAGKMAPITRFTSRQLEAGQVQYQHNGSEALTDQFSIIARVTAGERDSLPATVRVTVLPVDDEKPTLVNNTGLKLYEGAVIVIKPDQLGAEDVDSPAENITFVVSAPRGGFLSLRQAPRNTIERFTQAQLHARQVLFVHNGDVKNSGFHVSLTDGINSKSDQYWVNVTVKKLTLSLARNSRLHVFPLLRQAIGPKHLLALTSDPSHPPRHITFTIKTPPVLGRILTETAEGAPKEVSSFSQRDVNDTRIWYEHTKVFTDLAANDSFVVDVSTEFAEPLLSQVFSIDISVSSMTSDGLDRFLKVEPIVVDEGGAASIKINTSGVAKFLQKHSGAWSSAPSVLVLLTGTPTNGEVLVQGGQVAEPGSTFTQTQLDTNLVIYQHDHSDTLTDEILFSLILQVKDEQQDEILLYNGSISITIRAINDQQFFLRTNSPNMSVVQGQSKLLTPDDLLTEDPDTPPQWITYDIINEPKQGRLVLVYKEERNGTIVEHTKKTGKFTQEDINRGHVVYEHSGPLQPTSFYFRVSDGHFNPIYTVFNIHILPLQLAVKSTQAVAMQQGLSVAFVTSDNIDAHTNGNRINVHYNVTTGAQHGKVYLRDSPTESFAQSDVDTRQLMYMQTDMTTSSDSFVIVAWLPGTDVHSDIKQINVTVEPLLVRSRNLSAIAGAKNRIGLECLDATPLAKLTNSNPMYELARKPKFGRVKKIIRVTGHNGQVSKERERDVTRFSHEEIKSGVIFYVSRKAVEQHGSVEDGMTLVLSTSIFQPAVVEMNFRVRADKHEPVDSNPNASVSPPRRGGTSLNSKDNMGNIVSPNINPDYVLLIAVIFGIISLSVLVIALVKCRGRRRRGAANEHAHSNGKEHAFNAELMDAAPTLPRPPDNLLPLSPRPHRSKRFVNGSVHYSDSGDSWRAVSPIAVPIPQCKVLPPAALASTVDVTATTVLSSEPTDDVVDINVRYPYGVADEPNTEDWSSFDTQSELQPAYPRSSNPMLRRNQYWV